VKVTGSVDVAKVFTSTLGHQSLLSSLLWILLVIPLYWNTDNADGML